MNKAIQLYPLCGARVSKLGHACSYTHVNSENSARDVEFLSI